MLTSASTRISANGPGRVEYGLTPLGREVAKRLGALAGWIEENLPRVEPARREKAGAGRAAPNERVRQSKVRVGIGGAG
jgi:hypothetical protein